MMRYFLDTSIIIAYLRQKQPTADSVDQLDGELFSSFICLSELYEGIAYAKERKRAEEAVLGFFQGLAGIFSIDSDTARRFGYLRAHLKARGEVLEDIDTFIAATCLSQNTTLVTLNVRHFKRVPDLLLYTIP